MRFAPGLLAALLLPLPGLGCAPDAGQRGDAELAAATGGDPRRGAVAIAAYGCGACHVIPGIRRARGMVGPPLTDFARRGYIAGAVSNRPANLIAWIRRPDSIEPATVMPTLGVGERQARDIAAYLYLETATSGTGPPRLLPATVLPGE